MRPLTNDEIKYLMHNDRLQLNLMVHNYIVYFKVTDTRVKIWYYVDDIKFIISMTKPINMFNKYKIGSVYNLEALLNE